MVSQGLLNIYGKSKQGYTVFFFYFLSFNWGNISCSEVGNTLPFYITIHLWSYTDFFFCLIPRAADKADADADGEDGKKKKGGIQVPEEWPWEEAKKLFEHPDVTPAAELEVGFRLPLTGLTCWL